WPPAAGEGSPDAPSLNQAALEPSQARAPAAPPTPADNAPDQGSDTAAVQGRPAEGESERAIPAAAPTEHVSSAGVSRSPPGEDMLPDMLPDAADPEPGPREAA